MREYHVRICEGLGVKFPGSTRHSRPSHFVPVLNNVRYASDSDHSKYESELTLWANHVISAPQKTMSLFATGPP